MNREPSPGAAMAPKRATFQRLVFSSQEEKWESSGTHDASGACVNGGIALGTPAARSMLGQRFLGGSPVTEPVGTVSTLLSLGARCRIERPEAVRVRNEGGNVISDYDAWS